MNRFAITAAAFSALLSAHAIRAEDKPVKLADGDRVAILGDSITEQKQYSALIEDYLLACQPAMKVQAAQFGWGGETTWGFAPRMGQDVLWFKPNAATIAYGMNDGGYGAVDAKKLEDYKTNMRDIIEQLKKAGTKLIVVGGPGAVDSDAFHTFISKGPEAAKQYNATLKTFGEAAEQVAKDEGVVYANLHNIMADAMEKFKQQHPGKSFVGGDGVHPDSVGHTVMAYAFLKGLGCDGEIGTINVDLTSHKVDASEGHKVISSEGNSITIESTRWPFQAKKNDDPMSVYSAMSLVPFEEELNRFTLKVANVPAGKSVRITWTEVQSDTTPKDDQHKATEVVATFDAETLAAGINLSSAFDTTPFEHAFAQLDQAVHSQQDFETPLTKSWLHRQKDWAAQYPTAAKEVTGVAKAGKATDDELRKLSAAMVVPVRHTLKIEIVAE